jgi:hypothetical protein
MDEKISLEAVALYGDSYANKILDKFFSGKEKISGPEILSLCNIQQVNLFVLRALFKAWKEDTQKLKSPYFDYENPSVKEALTEYMSVLSNHISIDRKHFSPLLKTAVVHTLMVVFNPYDFFSMLITGKNNRLDTGTFREEIKYLKVNKAPLERMLKKLEEKGITEIQGNEAFAVLDQILEEVNFTPEDLDDYISSFSSVVPLDPASFYAKADEMNKSTEQKKSGNSDFFQTVTHEERPVAKETKVIIEEKKTFIHETRVSEPTINDRMNTAKEPALLDSYRKISKIKENLSINQKFMFTKVLFYGDFESFSRVVDELDQLSDMNAALQYLEQHSSAWDRDSREFHEFMEMVEKRFS